VTTVVPSVPEKDRWLDGPTTSSGFAPFQSITVTPGHGIWVGNTAIRAVTDAGQIVTIVGRKNQEVRVRRQLELPPTSIKIAGPRPGHTLGPRHSMRPEGRAHEDRQGEERALASKASS
jgi:hypothetical protein